MQAFKGISGFTGSIGVACRKAPPFSLMFLPVNFNRLLAFMLIEPELMMLVADTIKSALPTV